MLLVGDIGGTKTVLAVIAEDQDARRPLVERTFASAHYSSLEKITAEFLADLTYPIDRACFGVAGPVIAGQVRITNLPWMIDVSRLQETLGIARVALLNDLQAMAYAVPHLQAEDLHTLHPGEPTPGGTIAVIAPGTGLGEAYLTWDGRRYHAYASEGGHTDFGPTNALEIELLRYYLERMDHVSYERFCSGSGLPNIYTFLRDTGYAEEPAWLAAELRQAKDPTPVIVQVALQHQPPPAICALALDLFVSILGAEAGNLALKLGAFGGVYLGGGIPPRILPALTHQRFLQSFLHKGRMSSLLIRMPVHVILNPRAALLGATYYGLERLSSS
jgi:glucokinase